MISALDEKLFCLPWPWPFVIVASAMIVLAVIAYFSKHLTVSGAFAACILGISAMIALRFEGLVLLLAFYVTSNIAGKVSKKIDSGERIEHKGSTRDWIQVCANGLCAVIMGFCWYFTGKNVFLLGFGASVAESTADTWAGEIGRLSKGLPLSIRNFKPVEKGTSGAVSPLGTVASALACVFISWLWSVLFGVRGFTVVAMSGFFGCLADSVLGAFCQALYKDPETGKLTEHPTQELVRGVRWIDNDVVNFISNLLACMLSLTFGALVLKQSGII